MTELQTVLNSLLVNEIVNGVLFLILLVLYMITLFERWRQSVPGGRDFSRFIAFFTGYVGLMLICLPAKEWGLDVTWLVALNFLRVLSAMAAYSCASRWIIYIIETRDRVPVWVRRTMCYGPFAIFGMFILLLYIFDSLTIANIPILCYYLMLQAMVIYYCDAMGHTNSVVFSMSIIPTLLLQAQEWWNYTPANIYLVMVIIVMYALMWTDQKERYLQNRILLAQKMEEMENIRTRLVLSQIRPHFVYNVMASITHLCTKNPKQAKKLSIDFTAYLRGNLRAADVNKMVPFNRELEHVKTYIKIESARFKDALKVVYDIQPTAFRLPVLTVEPLVENAVKHGVCQKDEGGTVIISTRELPDCWQIIVKDDGIGFDAENFDWSDKKYVGLRSVEKRIKLICKGALFIESQPGAGTTATLTIPRKKEEIL